MIKQFNKSFIKLVVKHSKKIIKIFIHVVTNNQYYINKLKNNLIDTYNFLHLLILYLIEKYYYKLNLVYFVLKAHNDTQTFNFFIQLNNLKNKLNIKRAPITINIPNLICCFLLFVTVVIGIPISLDIPKS